MITRLARHVLMVRESALIDRYLAALGGEISDRNARVFWSCLAAVADRPVDRLELPAFVRRRARDKGLTVASGVDRPWLAPVSS